MAVASRSSPGPGDGRDGTRVVGGPVRLGRRTKLPRQGPRPGRGRGHRPPGPRPRVGGGPHRRRRRRGAQLPPLVLGRVPEHGAAAARPGRRPRSSTCRTTPLFDRLHDGDSRSRSSAARCMPAARWSPGAACRSPPTCSRRPSAAAGRSARRSRPSRATPSSTWSRSGSCSSGKIELPRFDTDFRDRPALVVVRGVDHQARPARRCAPTSATCARCSSASTAAPTRSSRRASGPT